MPLDDQGDRLRRVLTVGRRHLKLTHQQDVIRAVSQLDMQLVAHPLDEQPMGRR